MLRSWAAVLVVPLLAIAAVPGSAATPKPHISLTPDNVMVNTTVTVLGHHFPASSKVVLRECGQKTWVVTQTKSVCSTGRIKVHTDKRGRFTTTYVARVCPHDSGTGPVTRAKCFIGEPLPSGVDTLALTGHAKLIVTYP
jgi:hypothetical protein